MLLVIAVGSVLVVCALVLVVTLVRADQRPKPMQWEVEAAVAGIHAELAHLLLLGRKIQAIKRVREVTGLGLAEAKDLVDDLERRIR